MNGVVCLTVFASTAVGIVIERQGIVIDGQLLVIQAGKDDRIVVSQEALVRYYMYDGRLRRDRLEPAYPGQW